MAIKTPRMVINNIFGHSGVLTDIRVQLVAATSVAGINNTNGHKPHEWSLNNIFGHSWILMDIRVLLVDLNICISCISCFFINYLNYCF